MPDTKEMNLDVNLIIDDAVEESLKKLIKDTVHDLLNTEFAPLICRIARNEIKVAIRYNIDGLCTTIKHELEKYG